MEWRRWNGGDGISKMEYGIANWGLRILKQDLCLPLLACGHSQFDLRNCRPPPSYPLPRHAIRDSTFAIRNPFSFPLLVHSCLWTFAIRPSQFQPHLLSCFLSILAVRFEIRPSQFEIPSHFRFSLAVLPVAVKIARSSPDSCSRRRNSSGSPMFDSSKSSSQY